MNSHIRSLRRPMLALSIPVALLFVSLVPAAPPDGETLARGPSLGLAIDSLERATTLPPVDPVPELPLTVRLTVRWAEIETHPGVYDWTRVRDALGGLAAAGYVPTVVLTGSHPSYVSEGGPPTPLVTGAMEGWLRFVRSAVRTLSAYAPVFEIWDRPSRRAADGSRLFPADVYAFVLKQTSLAIRAEADAAGREVLVAQGALDDDGLDWQERLWDNDVAAYVDLLPLSLPARSNAAKTYSALYAAAVQRPPAPLIWGYLEPDDGGGSRFADAVALLAAGCTRVALPATRDSAEDDPTAAWTAGAHRLLGQGFAPAPLGDLAVSDETGALLAGAAALGRFLNDEDFSTLVGYDTSVASPALEQARLIVDSSRVRNARSLDPVTGLELRTAAVTVPGDEGKRSLRVPVRPYPVFLRFERAAIAPGLELPPEEVEVASTRGLTAEEIIARYQRVQQIQDDRLERWIARGRTDLHFKLAQGGSTVDVGIASNYFWERGAELEWEQTDYYINGNRVGWKNIPELPLIQPEKVVTLPLDLTLDKTYGYRLVGDGRVGERDAYVLEFQPADPDAPRSLYRGRIWIDREGFQRLKLSVVQSHLEAPVLSNEERDTFAPFQGPDGFPYWMLAQVDGQQVWSAGGRNFVVRRELIFTEITINPPRAEFEAKRSAAYASNNQMLRDTDQGFRYLERQDDGSRVVKQKTDTSQIFAAGGAFKDQSTDGVTPLAGVNYFNYDLAQKDIQFNVLFAGVLAFVNASKAGLFGKRLDLTAEAAGVALKFDEEFFVAGNESTLEQIRQRPQTLTVRLGKPLGQFAKLTLVGNATWFDYARDGDTQRAIDEFNTTNGTNYEYRLPEDHMLLSTWLEFEINRRGYSFQVNAGRSKRSDWTTFGLFDNDNATFLEFDGANYNPAADPPVRESFDKWGASVFKEWYLPKFQKLRGELNYLDGNDLDRFSRYQFSFFGDDRLNGFAGSGVRFDRGLIGRVGYAFNLFEVIRFDVQLESARVRQETSAAGDESFTGIGLSGNFVGPWKTVISINYGRALASDVPALEGEQEFLLLVLKLF